MEKLDVNNFITVLNVNDILLYNDFENNDFKEITSKINVENIAMYYQIAKLFNCTQLNKLASSYVERCFTIVCETPNFLELDFIMVSKILGSSELRLDSELEVLDAAESWVGYDYEGRSKFAKDLSLKIRLPLTPFHDLNSLSSRSLRFSKIDACVDILRKASQNKKSMYQNKTNTFFTNRFCTQSMFNIVLSGGLRQPGLTEIDCFQQVDGESFDVENDIAFLKSSKFFHKTIYCKGEIYVFGGRNLTKISVVSVEKYSLITSSWEHVADMPDDLIDSYYCPCAFMHAIFIVGGCNSKLDALNSCLKFDTKDKKWEDAASLNDKRSKAACAVFQGRLVVSGGWHEAGYNSESMRSVEAYDCASDTWSRMPSMIERRYGHGSVAVKNKLFVVACFNNGNGTCEVYDSACKKFVFLKQKPSSFAFSFNSIFFKTFSVGSKFIAVKSESSTAVCFDVEKDEWSEEPFEVTKTIWGFGCTVVPKM